MALSNDHSKDKSVTRGSMKVILYIALLVASLSLVSFLFGWASYDEVPHLLQPYSSILLLIHPYLTYIQAALVFGFGYLAVNAVSGLVYAYMRRVADHPTAATIKTLARISGIAILLSLMTSVFNVNPAAALTVGSFGGLVVGFATQNILSNVVAGVFLLLSRPFTYGDVVTIKGQTGTVKQIKLMHLVLESEDEKKEVLIPSGIVVSEIIQRKKPLIKHKPLKTTTILEKPPATAVKGTVVRFTGRLVETATEDPIASKLVKIFDSDVGRDDLLASGTTMNDGSFIIKWTAKKTGRWDATEIYAEFEGDKSHKPSKSGKYTVTLRDEKKPPE